MAVKSNAADAAQAWVTGMGNATTKYTAGVQAVKTAPGTLAAAQAQKWATNVAAAVNTFSKNVGAVSLASWQSAAVNKGAPRLASGATAAQPKFQSFMNSFIPTLTNIVNGLPARGTYDQNISRLTSYLSALHAQKGNF